MTKSVLKELIEISESEPIVHNCLNTHNDTINNFGLEKTMLSMIKELIESKDIIENLYRESMGTNVRPPNTGCQDISPFLGPALYTKESNVITLFK